MDRVMDLVNLGVEEKRNGKYISALSYYNKALQLDNSNPEVHNALGKIYFILGDYEKAFSRFVTAASISAQYIDVGLLSNNYRDPKEIIESSIAKGQSQSLVFNLGKHSGFSLIAGDYNGVTSNTIPENERPLVNAGLRNYRKQIDPTFDLGYINHSKEDLQLVEDFATEKGILALNEYGKTHNKHLMLITEFFLNK